jgi:hypothetical protein
VVQALVEVAEVPPLKKRGPKFKYATPEERIDAKRALDRQYYANDRETKKEKVRLRYHQKKQEAKDKEVVAEK